ncbi:MAG: apolipoprotein N-acyltransferase [Alcanivoracaceae bacterium]|nr:apolipoprotein N-acyltransferase [Alcanivoracaceae bacterium]
MQKLLIAFIAGLIYPLGFSPWSQWLGLGDGTGWPLMMASIALGWWTLDGANRRQALARGYLFGLGQFLFGVYWLYVSIHVYGFTPLPLAVIMTGLFAAAMALYPALLFWLVARLGGHPLVFAGGWVLVDALRGWLLTGFPWLYPGYAMIDTPLAGTALYGGIWLLTLLSLASAVSPWAVHAPRRYLPLAVLALAGWLLGLASDADQWTSPAGDMRPVALVQGDIPQDIKWATTQQSETRQIYDQLTAKTDDNSLVIWPESAVTEFYQDALPWLNRQRDQLQARGSTLVTGIPWRTHLQHGYSYHNSIAVVDGQGGVYHKQKLVPFGEYVPLQDFLRGMLPFFDLPMSSFRKGDPDQPNLEAAGVVLAPFICYEVLYPQLVAERSRNSDVLLTISNDAWFGHSAGPLQHFQMTRLRAIETGRWLLRGTNNGVTAVIDADGQVVARLPQFTRDVLESRFQPRQGTTPWQALGSVPWLLLAVLLAGAGYLLERRRDQS